MVCKWMAYNPLKLEERIKIKEAIDLDMSYSEMAEYVGRAKSVVMREAKRFGHYTMYDPEKAQKQFEKNASPPRKLKK